MLTWNRGQGQVQYWNEIAAWAVETFGLPGDRYITDLNINDMTWWFRTSEDRLIFILKNGKARCMSFDKLTKEQC